ncbi:MAG: hypothetical protein K9G26_00130 [Emcibacter sp.]|nr:hypothetical protein [Emcibacter sp.]
MTETILDSLVVKIRADSADLRGQLDNIEKDFGGLETAAARTSDGMTRMFANFARSGELSFSSLRQVALSVLNDIANSAIQSGLNNLFGGSSIGNSLGSIVSGALFGRAGGGSVNARAPYLVGERGPELFVPENAGRIIPNSITNGQGRGSASGTGRPSNITINITNQGASNDMTSRSAGQVAVAVRRAMDRAERDL